MAEWLYEDGIGEARAAFVENGLILEAAVERPDGAPRHGAVHRARFGLAGSKQRTAIVELDGAGEAYLPVVPAGIGPGSRFTVEVVRERLSIRAVFHRGRSHKAPRVRVVPDETPLGPGPSLRERIAATGLPVRTLRTVDPDALEAAGWSELIGEALTGKVEFSGGALLIQLTEGMTVIDVDGQLEPDALSVLGAEQSARAIRRLGLAGSIGIDLPTVAGRDARKRAAEAFDAAMAGPFERTAVNGWGFMQVIRPRHRPSLMEIVQGDEDQAAAIALYRQAERDPWPGAVRIAANHDVATAFGRTANDAVLAARRGGAVTWEIRSLGRWNGHVHVLRDASADGDGEDGVENVDDEEDC